MHAFDDLQIMQYVLGEAAPEVAQNLEAAARNDVELAAQIEVMAWLAHVDDSPIAIALAVSPNGAIAPPHVRARWLSRKLMLAASVLIALSGIAWGSFLWLAPQPLLADNFNNNWLDPQKWKSARRPTRAEHGYLRLNNRASVVTVQEFKAPIEIELDWKWIDDAGDVLYRDSLSVVLHTSGAHEKTRPFLTADGIEVVLQSHYGQVGLASPMDPTFGPNTGRSVLPMPAGEWHHVRIVDDGKSISVYLSGPKIDRKYDGKPVFTAPYKGDFTKHHIAIFNREIVADALHESHIDNVVIRRLEKN